MKKFQKIIVIVLGALFAVMPPLHAVEMRSLNLPSLRDFELLNQQSKETHKAQQTDFSLMDTLEKGIAKIKNVFFAPPDLDKGMLLHHLLETYKNSSPSSPPLSITASRGDQLFLWQNLNGDFHALLRGLRDLREKGVLDDSLRIRHNSVKVIFLGNVVDASQSESTILSLILTLLIQNPGKVFFLKGANEEHAEKFYAKQYQAKKKNPERAENKGLAQALSRFFSSLPQVLVCGTEGSQEFMLFSSKTEYAGIRDVSDQSDFALSSQNTLRQALPLVRIQNVDRKNLYLKPNGLDQAPQFQGATTWTIASSPTLRERKIYDYSLEAFGMIEVGETLHQSTITSYTRDQRGASSFDAKKYALLKGTLLTEVFEESKKTGSPIFLASSMDLTEGSSILGKRILYGTDLKVRQQNREGGIHNNSLHIVYSNDKYIPSLALSNAKSSIEKQGINLFLSTQGAPTGMAMLQYAKEGSAALVFPVSGSAVFRQPDLGTVVNYRASYEREIKALVHHARNTLLKRKFAVFSNANKTGQILIDTATNTLLKDYNMSPESVCQIKIPPNNLDVVEAARKVRECNPDVIILLSGYATSRALINEIGVQFLSNITLMGYSFITDHFKEFISGLGQHEEGLGLEFIMARVVPNPKTSSLEIVRDYRAQMDQQYPGVSYDSDSLEGYMNASILIKALENLTPPYTPSKVVESLKSFKNVKFKGLTLTYDEEIFGFSKDVWLDLGQGEWKYYNGATENFASK